MWIEVVLLLCGQDVIQVISIPTTLNMTDYICRRIVHGGSTSISVKIGFYLRSQW